MTESRSVIVKTSEGWLTHHESIPRKRHGVTVVDGSGQPMSPTYDESWLLLETRPVSPLRWSLTTERHVGPWKLNTAALHDMDPARWPMEVSGLDFDADLQFYDRDIETVTDEHELGIEDAVVIERPDRPLPDGSHARRWKATAVNRALNAPELAPWFAGRLTGFRAHMALLLAEMPEVSNVYCSRPGTDYEPKDGPRFSLQMRWEPPRTARKTARESRVTISVSMADVPLDIEGDDLWEAAEAWAEAEARWFNEWEQIGAASCGACGGKGWISVEGNN